MLIVKIETVNPNFETHDGHKSILEALIDVWAFQDFRWKYQKKSFQPIGTLQVKMSQLRPWRKKWNLEFWRKRKLKMIVNREDQQLCFFFGLFGFLRKVQKKTFCKNFFVWEREFFSEASTAEIEPVVTKKDDLDYRVELFLLVPSKMFGILGFWFKQ